MLRKFLGKLFKPASVAEPENAPVKLKVWDEYGRVMEVSREDWRDKILPENFRRCWHKPDELAALISNALHDGFVNEVLNPARQLHRIDTEPKRGALFLAVVLLQHKEFTEAKKVIDQAIRQHGVDGSLLTNLAKAQAGLGDQAASEKTLWHALELDPNQDNGFYWYVSIHRERGGIQAEVQAMQKVAALPRSWRANLRLAHRALSERRLEDALAIYRECIGRVDKPLPTDMLKQISGDLGNQGHLPEIIELVSPHFKPSVHGIDVGNNLIKAHLDLGQLAAGRKIIDQLYALKRADWNELLSFWDTELAKAHVSLGSVDDGKKISIGMLAFDGPIWLKPSSPAAECFPAKSEDSLRVCFLGSTAEVATNSKRPERQLANPHGRMSRMLPLFMAEQTHFRTEARTLTLVPWLNEDVPGFVLTGGPWDDDAASECARGKDYRADYIVTIHLKTVENPWRAESRLIRSIDAKCLGELSVSFDYECPEAAIIDLTKQLLDLLKDQAGVETCEMPKSYTAPNGAHFAPYLLRLEQLLAVRCSTMEGVAPAFLSGEHEIIDGNLQLCLDFPQNVNIRILLAQTLLGLKRNRSAIVLPYREKIVLLQKEKPLIEPAQTIVQRLFNDAFTI